MMKYYLKIIWTIAFLVAIILGWIYAIWETIKMNEPIGILILVLVAAIGMMLVNNMGD